MRTLRVTTASALLSMRQESVTRTVRVNTFIPNSLWIIAFEYVDLKRDTRWYDNENKNLQDYGNEDATVR